MVAFVALAACSSASSSSALAPDGGAVNPGGPVTGEEEEGGTSSEGGKTSGGKGPFDLSLTIRNLDTSGAPATTLLFVVVRDAETKEIIGTAHDDENVVTRVKIAKKAALEKGHRYEIGVKDTWFTGCLDEGANVWYREIPEVDDHVTLDFTVAPEVDEDPRGCDVLHAPVDLPAGSYSTSAPINGVSGNRVTLVVSPTGRVYAKEFILFCDAPSQCVPTTLTHGACEWEEAVYPGETTFRLVNNSGSNTSVEGTATIDSAAKTIRYVGRTTTYKAGGGSMCCDDTFDVTLTKTSTSTAGCK